MGLCFVIDGHNADHDPLPVETINRKTDAFPIEDIIVCDQKDCSVKIYRGTEAIWQWQGRYDAAIDSSFRSGFSAGIAECKVCSMGGRKAVAVADNNNRWAIVDIATTNAVAWGESPGMPHSIEILPGDIVAVASTDTDSDPSDKGVYFYHIAGEKAKDPSKQNRTMFAMDNPHGLYWDAVAERLYVSSSTGLHRMNVAFDALESRFDIIEEKVYEIAPLGVKWGHDLAAVPGTRKLAMTTYELTLFFDLETETWQTGDIVWRMDVKAFDPHADGSHFLVVVPRALPDCSKTWVNDTVEIYTGDGGFRTYIELPGTWLYKARWAGDVLGRQAD